MGKALIRWSSQSSEDLYEIYTFIASGSPFYANVVVDRIIEMVEHFRQFPQLGRQVPELNNPEMREFIFKDYRIICRIKSEFLEVVDIVHGRGLATG